MTRVLAAFALMALAGCELKPTTHDLYVSGPLGQGTFPRNYAHLAACVTHAIGGKYPVSTSVEKDTGTATLSSEVYYRSGLRLPLWILTIKRVDNGHSHAEVIATSTYKGNFLPPDLWPVVETCGKAT
jgi:hypothetical protein